MRHPLVRVVVATLPLALPALLVLLALLVLTSAPCAWAAAPEWAVAVFPSGAEFTLEIAADPESRRLGYMFREHVGRHEGMLFLFPAPGLHDIWMRNCEVALDVIWLDATLRVVHVAHDLQPCPPEGPCPSTAPPEPATYVLEVAAGTTRREGFGVGDRLVVIAEPPLPSPPSPSSLPPPSSRPSPPSPPSLP